MPYASHTIVSVEKTRVEIERLLEKHKARQYGTAVDHETRRARVQFRLADRIVRFVISLPDPTRYTRPQVDQLERQRWRALLLVIKAKLESVESAIETFEQAFLAQVVLPDDSTVGDAVQPYIADAYATGRMPRQLTGEAEG